MVEPTCSPIGIIDISTPSVNRPIPKIIIKTEKMKEMKMAFGKGQIVKDRSKMIKDTGNTEATDSLIFSKRMVFVFMWGSRVLSVDKISVLFLYPYETKRIL
jgi:hypothetical protein